MSIVVIGLNYRTAPVELREKLTLSGCALHLALDDLRSQSFSQDNNPVEAQNISEAVILSTCNRLEVYASTEQADGGAALIEQFLSELQNIPAADLKPHLYSKIGDEAVHHLMRVACGLDSMILGETQILGQVTNAFEEAQAAGITGPILSHLFSQAIHTGKRARTETPISRYTTSVSHAAATLVAEKLQLLSDRRVLIVGAGEMAALAAQALRRIDVSEIAFINRTYSRAETLAAEWSGRALAWHQLGESLVWADAVISATGAPHTVVYASDVETAMRQRDDRSLVMVDIAVPRDIEDIVSTLPGVQYHDIDDLQSVVDTNMELRKAAVPQVERIIQQEMARFDEWYHSRQVTPIIKTLREWAEGVAADELVHALNRLPEADERTQQVVSHLAHRLINRILHEPTSRLRLQAAEGNGYGYAHAVRELFGLNDHETPECQQDDDRCGVMLAPSNGATLNCKLNCIISEQIL